MKLPLAVALLALPVAAWAAGDAPVAAADPPPEPAVTHQISEDDHVRIDELRVRGQTQSITVHSKIRGLRPYEYEIVPYSGARDPSQAGSSNGQRVWHVLSF